MILLGDISLNGAFFLEPQKNSIRFKNIEHLFSPLSLVFANLEMPLKSFSEKNENKSFIHYSSAETTRDVLKRLHVSCVSLANNHIYDCKMSGLRATIELLDEIGVSHTGAGWKREHIKPVILKHNNKRIGFISYVDVKTNPKTETFHELLINYLDVTEIKKDIYDLKNMVDCIICSLHWGTDYSNFYTKKQQKIAHELIESGVDIIMGHHPHTIQPFEIYKGKYIFYSLGQLCFGDFIWEGELRSLKRKTKTGIIVAMSDCQTIFKITGTIERKNNIIDISKLKTQKKLKHLSYINKLFLRYKAINFLCRLKESFLDRFYEFFFGYYRNPIKQIVSVKNIFKIKYLFRDFFNRKSED